MQAVAQTILNSCSELPGCRLKCRQEPAGLLDHPVPVALCGLIPAFTICGAPCPVSFRLQPARGSCYSSSRNPHPRAHVLSRAMILYRAITSATSLQSQVSLGTKACQAYYTPRCTCDSQHANMLPSDTRLTLPPSSYLCSFCLFNPSDATDE